eukprot:306338-Amphidinium_carterae.1
MARSCRTRQPWTRQELEGTRQDGRDRASYLGGVSAGRGNAADRLRLIRIPCFLSKSTFVDQKLTIGVALHFRLPV